MALQPIEDDEAGLLVEEVEGIGQAAESDDEPGGYREPSRQKADPDQGYDADADSTDDGAREFLGKVAANPSGVF